MGSSQLSNLSISRKILSVCHLHHSPILYWLTPPQPQLQLRQGTQRQCCLARPPHLTWLCITSRNNRNYHLLLFFHSSHNISPSLPTAWGLWLFSSPLPLWGQLLAPYPLWYPLPANCPR